MGFDIECIIDIHTYPGEYFCPVCRTLVYPNEALQTQCTHLYCKACLPLVSNGSKACPYDGYLVLEADSKPLIESNKTLAESIGKVKVRCLFHKSGCTWEGVLSECTSHCSGCAFGNSPVICNRCGVQIVHRQVHEHAQSCPGVYQAQQTAEVNSNSQSGAPATSTAGADQNRQSAQPGPLASQVQNPQTTAAPQLPGQDLNQQANTNSQAPAAVATPEQWYQQQYQQYYQQYAGYDPYQQSYQPYYPYQQGMQQYQQHPSHVQGQPQPQVYTQPQAQSQAQSQPHSQAQSQPHSQAQPQLPAQSQPQAQVPTQVQVQPHPHIQPSATQHQNQSQMNPQQQFQSPVQSHAQVPSQSYPPVHGQPPQPYSVQPHPQHMQVSHYQQPSAQMHNAQPPVLPQPHSQVQPQLSMRPPQSSQPAVPNVQPQTLHPTPHPVTGHQSYPQPQPAHQMPVGAVASGSFPSVQAQGQILQQRPMMHPPPAPNANQQQGMLPPQGQVLPQQSHLYPNTQHPGAPIQSRPPQAIQQLVPQQPFAGPFPSHSHQQGPYGQQQQSHLHPPGPPHMVPQSSHASVQSQPNVALGPGMHPQPPQNYFGRPVMQNQGLQLQPVPLAPSGSGIAPSVRTMQHGLNQPPISQSYANSVNNQLQISTDQKKPVVHESQPDPSSVKPENSAEVTITSQSNADKDATVLETQSFETNGTKLETGLSSEQDAAKECAKTEHPEKGNSNDPVVMKQTVKEEHTENALELSSGAKSADAEVVIERASFGRVPGHFPLSRGIGSQSNTSQGFPLNALPSGSTEIRDGMGRASLTGPEGHFGPQHAPLNVPEGHFGQQHMSNPMEAEMFQNRRMNGFDRGLPYHTEASRDERLKVTGGEHPGTFPVEPRWPIDQGSLDKVPRGFGYDGNVVAPSRLPSSYHPPGAPYINNTAEREVRHGLLNDERRNADFVHRHSDFMGPGPGFGPRHIDRLTPRSPDREFFGIPPRGYLPRGRAGFDDVDGREAQTFAGGSRPFGLPTNPVSNSFHEDRFHALHRHPQGDAVNEHVAGGPPHNHFRGGELFGNDVPSHLRMVDPLGPRNLPSHLHVGEPAGFGPFPGPGNLSHLPFSESFGGNKPGMPRLGEPGFRSRYSLHRVSNEGTYMGDVDSFDRSRKRASLSMGWCRICKVDCETVEGLDMHSQTREHQNMAMDMVRNIKEQNRKRLKNRAAVEEGGKKRNAAFEGCGNKPRV